MKEACMKVVAERDVRMDSKKRVTLTGAEYEHYRMRRYDDGRILLEPRVLRVPDAISRRTLSHVDEAMTNLSAGITGEEFDLDEVQDLIDEP
jgi:hypothetical protein